MQLGGEWEVGCSGAGLSRGVRAVDRGKREWEHDGWVCERESVVMTIQSAGS